MNDNLPPLPDYYDRVMRCNDDGSDYHTVPVYSADDMRAYGLACAMAERERCARLLRDYKVPVGNSAAGELACEWTMDALQELHAAIRGAKA